MGVWTKRALRVLVAFLGVVAVVWLALWYFIPSPPSTISIAAGFKGSAYERFALRYKEKLARAHVTLNVRITGGALDDLKLVEDRNSRIDAAFVFGGLTNSEKSPDLISLGRINFAPVWLFYRATETLDNLTQLKGKRIAVGQASRVVFDQLLAAHGVNSKTATLVSLTGPGTVKALKDREIDVVLITIELNAPFVQSLLRDPTVRLMNVTQAEGLTRVYPFLTRLVLPQGVVDFEKNIPANDVNLIALTNAVVVRKGLHPELVYLLAQTLAGEHGAAGIFNRVGEFPTQTDPEFPMAEEAVDYYRNGPSFLQRYLPFWMVNYAKRMVAILVTVVAVIIPLFTYAPKLYDWFLRSYLKKLYSRLRAVENELGAELSLAKVEALQSDLASINRAARILPMRHSDLFIDLVMHIRQTHCELTSRLKGLGA